MAVSEAAIKVNDERQAGYKHGLRSLEARATRLGRLPPAKINFQPSGPAVGGDLSLDFVALLGDESKILCGDSSGGTSLYDADSHSILTMHGLKAPKGLDAISISITRAANGYARPYDSLFVMNRTPDSKNAEYLLEELKYGSEDYSFSNYPLIHPWESHLPPRFIYHPAYKVPSDIGAYAVVGSTIYVSSVVSGIGTYSFDTMKWAWRHAGEWMFCTAKTFLGTLPPMVVGFSDNEDDDDEAIDLTDAIASEFVVFTGLEVVRSCDGESLEGVRMIKHKSRFYTCEDHDIKWVL
nr:unnamed protein product [Digitaria exilis]